jgi:hypothetical protein
MSIATKPLVKILKKTIDLLNQTEDYQWGHMGSCNCGHLAQAITGKTHAEIHNMAIMSDGGDWSEKAKNYCYQSGLPVDEIIEKMLSVGLSIDDIRHVEYLSHPKILKRLADSTFKHKRNSKTDVVLYFTAWVEELENKRSTLSEWNAKVYKEKEVVLYDSVPETEFA